MVNLNGQIIMENTVTALVFNGFCLGYQLVFTQFLMITDRISSVRGVSQTYSQLL